MLVTYIPSFLLECEDLISLKEKKIMFKKGTLAIGPHKVSCYEFLNLSVDDVFNKLEEDAILESTSDADRRSFASRLMAILFLRIREAMNIKDKEIRLAAMCGLTGAVTSMYQIEPAYARRMLPLLRAS